MTQTPFITPARLKAELSTVFEIRPAWAHVASLASDTEPFDENLVISRIGESHPELYYLDPIAYVILYELTRYGNSVANNSNKKARVRDPARYLKLTCIPATDTVTVSRLVMDACPHEAVSSGDVHKLRAAFLKKVGSGKASKEARNIALRAAEKAARSHNLPEEEVALYLNNLRDLFRFHDETHGVVAEE